MASGTDYLTAALEYSGRGWRVIPVGPHGHPPMNGWQHEATVTARTIQRWFTIEYPDSWVGIATGVRSDPVVADLDVGHGESNGVHEWARLGFMFDTATVETKRGGRHLYFAAGGSEYRNSASAIAPGIDVRGEGGYVIAPPSPGYRWANDLMPAALPADVHALLSATSNRAGAVPLAELPEGGHTSAYGRKVLRDSTQRVKDAPEGTRRAQLYRSALYVGNWIAGGEIRADDARSELAYAAKVAEQHAYDAARTIEDGLARGAATPRRKP